MFSAALVLSVGSATSVGAKPRIGFGGLAGEIFAYRNQQLNRAGLPHPDHLNTLGACMRIPAGALEVAVSGLLEWRTVRHVDTLGGYDLAVDQLSVATSLRKPVHWRALEGFVGAGPAAFRLRSHLDPAEGRTPATSAVKLGAVLEAGLYCTSFSSRMQIGCGARYSAVPGPGVRGALIWVGLTVWPAQGES